MAMILVVEDDKVNQELLARYLKLEGHRVILESNGRAGVKAAQDHKPDLIVMDLTLPEMDGWEATKQMRADPRTSDIPIIALSAHTASVDVQKALSAGVSAYETKPIMCQRLMRKIASFC